MEATTNKMTNIAIRESTREKFRRISELDRRTIIETADVVADEALAERAAAVRHTHHEDDRDQT